jgi:hypothetical protein
MKIAIDQAIHDALMSIGHVPDNLKARFDGIAPAAGGGYTLALSDDDATALAELAQWHIKTDPATGRPTPQSAPFNELIRRIDEAQF